MQLCMIEDGISLARYSEGLVKNFAQNSHESRSNGVRRYIIVDIQHRNKPERRYSALV